MEVQKPVILFDGVCNFCNSAIRFVLRQDKKGTFTFAPLQSEAGQHLLNRFQFSTKDFDSFVLVDKGKIHQKSSAALLVLGQLSWYWKAVKIFWIVPRFLRDAVYDVLARNRYRWFGKKESCMVPTPEMRNRFLS